MHGLKEDIKTRRNMVFLADWQWVSAMASEVGAHGRQLVSVVSGKRNGRDARAAFPRTWVAVEEKEDLGWLTG